MLDPANHTSAYLDVDRAIRAATTLATNLSEIRPNTTTPRLLSNGSNVIVHLAPTPVAARVATITALVRPDVATNLATDLALADYLTAQGAPVVPPSREFPPGPHQHDGYTITFWTYVPHEPRHPWHPTEVGPLLADLHTAMRHFPGELPTTPPIEAPDLISTLRKLDAQLTPTDVTNILADAETITHAMANTTEAVPLHGDAHPGNLLCTPTGPVWTDFEDAWRGPRGWDLACLELTSRLDGRAAVASYPGPHPEPTPFLAARQLQTLLWSLVFHWRFPTEDRASDLNQRLEHWREHRNQA